MNGQQSSQSNQTSQPTSITPSPKKTWVFTIIIIITALVVGGGIYLWQKTNYDNQIEKLKQEINNLNNQLGKDGDNVKCPIDESSLLFNPVEFIDYKVYAKKQGDKEYVILCKSGQEIVIDQGDADWNADRTNINEVKHYNSLMFSPKGNFLIFTAARWEWISYYIYSIRDNRIVYKSDDIAGLEFIPNENYAYFCKTPNMSATDEGFIYKTDNFDKEEYNIRNIAPKDKILDIECEYNQVNNSIIFNVSEPGDLSTRKFYEYSLDKKEIIKQWD